MVSIGPSIQIFISFQHKFRDEVLPDCGWRWIRESEVKGWTGFPSFLFVQNDKNWIWKLQFRDIPFSAAVASTTSWCDEHLRWRAHRTGSNFRLVCTVCCTCCTGSVFNLADLTLFRVVSGARQLKAMEVMEMPAIQQAKPTGGRYWNNYTGWSKKTVTRIFFLADPKIKKMQ